MNITEVAQEALAYVENLSPEDRGNMLAVVAMSKETIRSLLLEAQRAGNPDALRFMQVAWFLSATVAALRYLENDR